MLLIDPHYEAEMHQLHGGETGSANGTLNNHNHEGDAPAAAAGAANSTAQVMSKATAWQEIAHSFVDPENQKYVSVVAASQDVLSEMPFWHGNIANKLAGWKLDEPLKLDPNLSEHNMAWLSKLSVNDLAA